MTPFPETEVMTIKRLEVALRKMDFRLLKDGAYKLHEKFHSGYKFEYINILRDILDDVMNNSQIPQDIKDVLIPTIEDILETSSNKSENRISTLTSLSYNSKIEQNSSENNQSNVALKAPEEQIEHQFEQEQTQEKKINAFEAFSSPKIPETQKTFTQSPFSAQPFQEFKAQEPISQAQTIQQQTIEQNNTREQDIQIQTPTQSYYEPQKTSNQTYEPNYLRNMQTTVSQAPSITPVVSKPIEQAQEDQIKTIAIFYNQDSSNDKIKNILRYRELLKSENINLNELLILLKDINAQSNTNVSDLKSILEQLNLKNHIVNLITNSNSKNLIDLLKATEIDFTLNERKDGVKLNILALLGLTNLFKCSQCKEEILNDSSLLTSFVLECPHCKSPMFPNLFALKDSICELDMTSYNASLISLANSKIWLIINPSLEEKTSLNMLRSALKISSEVEEIFIIDKDINVRETYKNLFNNINEKVKINTQISVIEDFFNVVK